MENILIVEFASVFPICFLICVQGPWVIRGLRSNHAVYSGNCVARVFVPMGVNNLDWTSTTEHISLLFGL